MESAVALRERLQPEADLSVQGFALFVDTLRAKPDARRELASALHLLSRAERTDSARIHAARRHLEESIEIELQIAANSESVLHRRAELVSLRTMDGDLEGALAAFDEISSRVGELPPAEASSVLRTVSQLRWSAGDLGGAIAAATSAVHRAASCGAFAQEAAAQGVLGLICQSEGNLDAAGEHYRRAVDGLRDQSASSVPMAVNLVRLGMLEHARGAAEEARRRLQEAVDLLRARAPMSWELGEALEGFAEVARAAGHLGEAASALRASARLASDVATRLRRELEVGLVYKELGRYDDAARVLSDVVHEALNHGHGDVHWTAAMALAGVHRRKGDLARAEQSYRELERRERLTGWRQIEVLSNLGGIQHERQNYQGAAEAYRQSLSLLDAVEGGSTVRPTLLHNLATALHGLGQLGEADDCYVASLRGARGVAAQHAEAWIGRGRIALTEGRLDNAVDLLENAVGVAEQLLAGAGGTENRGALFARLQNAHAFLIQALCRRAGPGDVARALLVVEGSRARELHERLFASEALLPQRRLQERELRQRLGQVSRRLLHLREVQSTLPVQLAELNRQEEELRSAVEDLDGHPTVASAATAMTADEIRAALASGEVLLEFHVVHDRVYLWAVTSGGLDLHILEPSVVELADLVAKAVGPYHVGSPPQASNEAAWLKLRTTALGPVAPLMRNARSLVVSPAGPLSLIAFEPLVDDIELVQYTPSATVGLRPRAPRLSRPRDAQFVGFGDPIVRREAPEFAGLPPLPGAQAEVEEIAALFGADGVAVCGANATERELRSWARRSRYLHIAAHGIVDLDNPLRSGIVLAAPAGSAVLAGFREDDVLHGYDMVDLDTDAELVVCAACRTGFGSERAGEGLATLGSALLLGGARWVLVSLWPVGDFISAAFMQELYGALRRGASVPLAVGTARQALRADHSDPYWWAAFVLFGVRP
ncbi:Tetratricopeptide repeat-containing protein [Geodermatophilus poikilotrophus]|uniref:Tetratricopeptide repeat-containing protein n=2 Tax=Geodermatophilus poikilotrophus TaxID=1333667 RepID=A0A1I0EPM1_9ACTN|nr:Tetratricopeptide repeat-containing protein [Geodermatophilus poikilotrophus]